VDRTARCSCGQLSVTVRGDPTMHGICSCIECQRLTGSSFYHHGYWAKSTVRQITGESTTWRRISEAGRWVDNYFCPVCGTGLYSLAEFDSDLICVSIGSFGDPSFPAPQYSIWQRHKHAWVQIPATCEAMDTQP